MGNKTWIGTAQDGNWATTSNWDVGSIPANNDVVFINELATSNISSGLNQTATGLTIYKSIGFTFQIGTATDGLNPGNGSTVYEGQPNSGTSNSGSPRTKYNAGAGSVVTFYIQGTGTAASADPGRASLQIFGGNTGSGVYVVGSNTGANAPKLDIGMASGQTGTYANIEVSAPGATVNIGPGMTVGALGASNGTTTVNCALTTLNVGSGAVVTAAGAGLIGTAIISGPAYLNHRNGGTVITTLSVLNSGNANFSQNPAAGTVGTTNLYSGGTLQTNSAVPSHITFSTFNKIGGGTLTLGP